MTEPCRLGLVALGDSITNGRGTMALGVTPLSWAQWLARGLELPYLGLAEDGALAEDVRDGQMSRVRAAYDVACLYAGVNDVRSTAWDPAGYEAALEALLGSLGRRAPVLVACTIPRDLGRPRAGRKVALANAIIRRRAAAAGAVVCGLDDLRGWHLVQPDAVHPTAVGQAQIAERAARALACAGVPVAHSPWRLAAPDLSLRAAAGHLPHHLGGVRRDVLRRVREGTLLVRRGADAP